MLQTDIQLTSSTSASRLDQLVAEMSARVEAGEPVDLVALTADCPELREQLEMLLPTLQAIADWKPDSIPAASHAVLCGSPDHPVVRGSPDPAHQPSTIEHLASSIGILGDFRIKREIGRGGMGLVYEAEQLSIGRRVALKVLPFAAMLDRQQPNRFKNEARAAGNQLWLRQFGTTETDGAGGVSTDALGNVYVGGSTNGSLDGPNAGGFDAFVNKYDASGNLLWTRQLGSPAWEGPDYFEVSADGRANVYLAGWTEGTLSGPNSNGGVIPAPQDAFVAKYDANGNLN